MGVISFSCGWLLFGLGMGISRQGATGRPPGGEFDFVLEIRAEVLV